mgnify:CR=1 FL=1
MSGPHYGWAGVLACALAVTGGTRYQAPPVSKMIASENRKVSARAGSLIAWGESLVDRMPIVRSIYNGVKQVAETVFSQTEAKFDKACLIQYPRPGVWGVGFVSTPAKGEVLAKLPADEVLTVFLPTTPNPTSGFLLYVPREDVIFLDMSVEDAAKLIISAGLVYPSPPRPPEPPAPPK